jgi:hypothetical protein
MSPAEAQIIALASGGVALVIWLVVVPLGLRGIFEALGTDRSRAWIPFVNLATVYRLGGQSEFWLVALVIPVSSWLGAIVLFVATHRINRRLGRSGWYTVLAVVEWWVWALALGLQGRIDRTGEAEPLIWSAQPRPQTSLSLPADDDSSTPPPIETPVSAAGFIAPMPGVVPTDAPAEPTRTPQPLTLDTPFVEEQREAPRLETNVEEQHESPRPPFVEEQHEPPRPPFVEEQREAPRLETNQPETSVTPDLHLDDDATIISGARADATVISPRRRPRWWVHTTMGARVELTGAAAILGRRPSAHPLYPGAQLIAVTDDALSVSATHAVLEFVDGVWQVTDLDSTNGVWLIGPDGGETELGARNRAQVTPQFMLGELGVKVVQGA